MEVQQGSKETFYYNDSDLSDLKTEKASTKDLIQVNGGTYSGTEAGKTYYHNETTTVVRTATEKTCN